MSLLLVLALTGCAADPAVARSCEAEVARLDTFGRLPWLAGAATLPEWSVDASCEGEDCAFSDPDGVRYHANQAILIDKELRVGRGTPLPWGLDAGDTPADAKLKLETLTGLDVTAREDRETPTLYVSLARCDHNVWAEVEFDALGRLHAVSLNAQP